MESLIPNSRRPNLSFAALLISACLFLPVEVLNAQPIVLENDQLRVELSQSLPSADRYILKSNSQVIYGNISYGFWTQVFHEGNLHYSYPNVDSITKASDRVCYHLRGELDSQQAVTFDLCYTLSGNSVELTFGNVLENPGYKLVVVRPPDLLNVRADQGNAKLVFPCAEGRLIDVATTNTGDWNDGATGGMLHTMLMGMLYHQGALAICSYDNVDIVLEERVFDHLGDRLGAIDIFFYYRHPPTDFVKASFVDVFDEYTTSLSAKLTFLADYDQDGDIDWIDGAKFLRDQVQAAPDSRYLSSWVTKIVRYEEVPISEQLKSIEKLYHLTDHNKIYGYFANYNPKIFSIFGYEGDLDPQWATLDELKQVFDTAEKRFNTFLSFNDVYLDYYPGTPYYDPVLRVVYPWGEFMGGWPLPDYSGAYRADPYDYAVQFGLQRVRNTLSRYPIRKSHHIDAFHFYPDKDHSLESPASREKNRRGLKLIINEFNKYGVDVTAEGLTGFFVGPGTGWFLDTPRIFEDNLPWSKKEIIPLIEFMYHGKTLYGLYEDIYHSSLPPEQVQIYAFLEPLLLGASSAAHITHTAPDDLELDKFYLIDLPWMALNQRFMQDYIATGDYRRITYEPSTFVEIDYKTNTYTVQVDGKVIGQNYMTFFPKDSLTFLIYSRNAKTVSYSLPRFWTMKNASLVKLTETGVKVPVPFEIVDNKIEFNAEANTPYKLIQKPVTLPWLLLLLD